MAVIPEAIKYVAVIYKPSLFVAVTPEAIKYVAFIYKPSLTCRHLHADHSGTRQNGRQMYCSGSIWLYQLLGVY